MQIDYLSSVFFVTGGAGFIGSYVVERLLKNGAKKVFILDNMIRGTERNLKSVIGNPRLEFIKGDIRDTELVNKLMSGSDYLFHMAALRINACAANPKEGFDVMCRATFDIADSAVRHNIKKVVYSSSASVYGMASEFPTTERAAPYDNQTFYGAAKLFGEQLFRSYFHMYKLPYVALRYFNVYGPRMDTDGKYTEVMIRWFDRITAKQTPVIHGDGSTSMDFVFVTDVADANIAALEAAIVDRPFNVACGRETSLKQLLDMMLHVCGSSLKPEHQAASGVNPVARRLADTTDSERFLGFKAKVSLEDGLGQLFDWYLAEKANK